MKHHLIGRLMCVIAAQVMLLCSLQAEEATRQNVALSAGVHGENVNVALPPAWQARPARSPHVQDFVLPANQVGQQDVSLRIYFEQRLDHDDALAQLRDFAALAKPEDRRLFTIDGWPALQLTRPEWLPAPDHAPDVDNRKILRIRTLVAVGTRLVVFNASLPVDASDKLRQSVQQIVASARFSQSGDPGTAERNLDNLTGVYHGSFPKAEAPVAAPLRVYDAYAVSDGANARIDTSGFGELEVAVDPTGMNVVVALQGRLWVSSNDGGSTFPNTGVVGAGNGDPSVGWGQSGKFYMAWIHTNCQGSGIYLNPIPVPDLDGNPGPDPLPDGQDCTGIARSDDNGVTFNTNTVNPAVVCVGRAPTGNPDNPGECFPDQEHIAVDRVNAGDTANDDQVYSTWRNFNPSDQSATLVCSSDSGVSWSAPLMVGPGDEVFPRITVGPDGSVYVATYNGAGMFRLYKYTSCVNGLTPVAGFPTNVQTGDFYECPFAGHDRCDQNPTSQTVIVDDFDANHVYYALVDDVDADNTNGYSNIRVHESVDGGASFPQFVIANEPGNARRVMPWVCSTGSDAVVTWYEQTGPLASDVTSFKGSRVGDDGGGTLVTKEAFTISEVPDTWCDIGWQCGTRWGNTATQTKNASEACPTQPQLAGICRSNDGNNNNDSGNLCDFSDDDGVTFTNCLPAASSPSGLNEICVTRGGCPKYGDYNGNACTAGKLFAAWASANAPAGLAPPNTATNNGVLFDVINLETDLPVATVPGNVVFDTTCSGDESTATLQVCNTGGSNLQVDTITSNNSSFAVTVPNSGFPVTISPDFCFPFEVTYSPTGAGDASGTLTIPTDDPYRPTVTAEVSGSSEEARIVTVLDAGFGDVCLGDTATHTLSILADSVCPLQITSVDITTGSADFSLATVMNTPFTLQGGEQVSLEVDFNPTGDTGAAAGTLSIGHNGENASSPKNISLSGNSPAAQINTFIANAGSFGDVCAGDLLDLNLTVQNDGACPLAIDSVGISGPAAGDFTQPNGNAAGTVVAAGNSVQIPIRFAPDAFDVDPPLARLADVEVDWHTQLASSAPPTDITPVAGLVPPPDLQAVIANNGDFGNVCKTEHADLDVTLFNQGACDLTISNISINQAGDNFELPANLALPLVLSPDADFNLPIRYSPEMCSDTAEMATLVIDHDDPTAPAEDPLSIDLSGTSPCPNLVIDPASVSMIYAFSPTVIDPTGTLGCFEERSAILRNNGGCPLTINDISASGVSGDVLDFSVVAPTQFPIILPSGEETLQAVIRFTPQADADPLAPSEVTGLLDIDSDDPDYAIDPASGQADLCGESVAQSGVRFLVTNITTGTPVLVDEVDLINIRSNHKNQPQPINIRLTDQPWSSDVICGNTVQWHVNQETLPAASARAPRQGSDYLAKAMEGNLQTTDEFNLGQCELRNVQLQLRSTETEPPEDCLLLPKGASCTTDSECCSNKCRGPEGGKTCK